MAYVLAQDLRNAVLQAAIQGKLTQHLSTDSSVTQLLMDIEEQKKVLIQKKEMKKEKPLPVISDNEILFDIPDHWQFVRTGNVIDCGSGSTPLKGHPEYYENGTIPWLKTGELNNSYILKCEEKITDLAYSSGSFRMNQPGDILIAMYGATIGKIGICTFPLTTNQACLGCTPLGGINNRYLFYFFMASKTSLTDKAEGGAQPNISRIKVRNHLMPLPPIEEQARIVARVDELMAKIDEYEKIEKELTELQKAFPGNMKDAILQAAMQGKLTEQLESDGNAFDLAKDIKQERAKLGKNKYVTDAEDDIDIPNNWAWIKSGECFSLEKGRKVTGVSLPYLEAKYLRGKSSATYYESGDMVSKGTKVILVDGENSGEVFTEPEDGIIGSTFKVLFIPKPINEKYALYFLDMNRERFRNNKKGAAIPHLSKELFNDLQMPIPPIEEQQRIVDKLDQLLPLCEGLEAMI